MAQILVKISPNWFDSSSLAGEYTSYITVGDIVTVQADDHVWGTLEQLPDFIAFKLVGVDLETAKTFEEELTSGNARVKARKYAVPINILEPYITANQSLVVVDSPQVSNFINNLVEKVAP